jgi:5-amino-6-(5-phosphoribosylamino)uracil reductase
MREEQQKIEKEPQKALRVPSLTVVLAMSTDGKIADRTRSAARFGSAIDKAHLEQQLAQADAMLFGAGTLRAYGTTLRVTHPELLQQRQGKQPIQIVCSRSAQLNPDYRFFQQPVPRWLLTTEAAAIAWRNQPQLTHKFDRILTADAVVDAVADATADTENVKSVKQSSDPAGDDPESSDRSFAGLDWHKAMTQFSCLGLEKIIVAGGGELVASLFAADLIDQLWLTVCPLILGGTASPSPVGGKGFPAAIAPRLELLSTQAIGSEVFLHYRVSRL